MKFDAPSTHGLKFPHTKNLQNTKKPHGNITEHSQRSRLNMVLFLKNTPKQVYNQAMIRKLTRLARITAHRALDEEIAHPELGKCDYLRGQAEGYIQSARILKEFNEWRRL